MCDDVSEALDRAPVRGILPERNMSANVIIIGGEFREDPPKVPFVDNDQMIGVRIPTITTTDSDGSRPPVPIDRDQCGAGAEGAVG